MSRRSASTKITRSNQWPVDTTPRKLCEVVSLFTLRANERLGRLGLLVGHIRVKCQTTRLFQFYEKRNFQIGGTLSLLFAARPDNVRVGRERDSAEYPGADLLGPASGYGGSNSHSTAKC